MKAGKGLMETFEASTGISLPRTSQKPMGLPVFKNRQFVGSLKELLESKSFERSFNFDKFDSQELSTMFEAFKTVYVKNVAELKNTIVIEKPGKEISPLSPKIKRTLINKVSSTAESMKIKLDIPEKSKYATITGSSFN